MHNPPAGAQKSPSAHISIHMIDAVHVYHTPLSIIVLPEFIMIYWKNINGYGTMSKTIN